MSKPYTLKKEVGTDTLRCLNSGQPLAISLLWALQQEDSESFGKYVPSDETVEDWIGALKSGKKIVNPLSPREEIRAIRNKYCQQIRTDGRKILIEQHDYCLLLLYAEKAVEEGEGND